MAGNVEIGKEKCYDCNVELINDSKNNSILGHYTCPKCKKGYNFFKKAQNYINKNQHINQTGLNFD